MWVERKRRVKKDSKILALSNWKKRSPLTEQREALVSIGAPLRCPHEEVD